MKYFPALTVVFTIFSLLYKHSSQVVWTISWPGVFMSVLEASLVSLMLIGLFKLIDKLDQRNK